MDLADAICITCQRKIIGLRGHEKIHEHFLSEIDMPKALENENYVIIPDAKLNNDEALDRYKALPLINHNDLESCKSHIRLSVEDLKKIVTDSTKKQAGFEISKALN